MLTRYSVNHMQGCSTSLPVWMPWGVHAFYSPRKTASTGFLDADERDYPPSIFWNLLYGWQDCVVCHMLKSRAC